MLIGCYIFVGIVLLSVICEETVAKKRQRRYLLFPPSTQWGVFATVSIPLHPESYVSVAWFFEANYYNVANATYFEPLLGDIETISRKRDERSIQAPVKVITRSSIYTLIESMLEKNGYPGRECLLKLICENAHTHFLHNGLMGDLIYLVLTPSASMSEDDIDDSFYEAEYYGLDKKCRKYTRDCPAKLLEQISLYTE
ncbi:uncharacterized protein LOC118274375 [Spodoptera frugiperda]|uniref:Uncharacterized protein LOC118274375 n=1 Tax=Spodoptera frugiperda TaxID=7108 RepID=A0A9R0DCI2_SPOFR|nr:uncharacterized protein LOC118274375 [Spodoptera frugiperda]